MTAPTPAQAPLWALYCACPAEDGIGWTDWFLMRQGDRLQMQEAARAKRLEWPGHLFAAGPWLMPVSLQKPSDSTVLRQISQVLWPPEDPEQSWSPDTIETIASLLMAHRPEVAA